MWFHDFFLIGQVLSIEIDSEWQRAHSTSILVSQYPSLRKRNLHPKEKGLMPIDLSLEYLVVPENKRRKAIMEKDIRTGLKGLSLAQIWNSLSINKNNDCIWLWDTE